MDEQLLTATNARGLAEGRTWMRRYAGDFAVVGATMAFIVLAAFLGLWMLRGY
jgi:hypothetical protein